MLFLPLALSAHGPLNDRVYVYLVVFVGDERDHPAAGAHPEARGQ